MFREKADMKPTYYSLRSQQGRCGKSRGELERLDDQGLLVEAPEQCSLGTYFIGEGECATNKYDMNKWLQRAKLLFDKAVVQGDAEAMYHRANLSREDIKDIKMTQAERHDLWRQAAELGLLDAMVEFGKALLGCSGADEVNKGLEWLRTVVKNGSVDTKLAIEAVEILIRFFWFTKEYREKKNRKKKDSEFRELLKLCRMLIEHDGPNTPTKKLAKQILDREYKPGGMFYEKQR